MGSQLPKIFYRPPISSKDTRHIWDEAGLAETADEDTIKYALDLWAVWCAHVYKKDDNDEYYIQWVNPSGYIIKTLYNTFVKWILVSSTQQPQQPQPQVNLTEK